MGVLGLHNECPPVNYSAEEAAEVSRGIVIDEIATAQTLRSVGRAIESLARMDDAVREIMNAWGAMTEQSGEMTDLFAPFTEGTGIDGAVRGAFTSLHGCPAMIDEAVKNYYELERYSAIALMKGRGEGFEGSLRVLGEGGFAVLLRKRVELLRKLKTRIILIQSLQPTCDKLIAEHNFPTFFSVFTEPMRDLARAANELYAEVVRGALATNTAMLRSCELVGDDAVQEPEAGGSPPQPTNVRHGAEVAPVGGE